MDRLFHKLEEKVEQKFDEVFHREGHNHEEQQQQPHEENGHFTPQIQQQDEVRQSHRFQSFAPQSSGGVKWFVDGASYFFAVSVALEQARESIYILDWWLSPELYLRRPPSRNEQYRLDHMLRAAADRGVKVNIIVYKEVTQALTLDSAHTRHHLEGMHPNIKVFRHPDHIPSVNDAKADLEAEIQGLADRFNAAALHKISGDALKSLYGSAGDVVLYWAHHEKLCIIDRTIAFMGGLDMCFGRWDTNSHPIADAHPGNLDAIIFPGQDYNNARIFDFEGVNDWDHNKLDRTQSSRMGWSDISISLNGPIVHNLIDHFSDRWNFILEQKYNGKDPGKYEPVLSSTGGLTGSEDRGAPTEGSIRHRLTHGFQRYMGAEGGEGERELGEQHRGGSSELSIQLCRSCTEWSAGHPTEHSIANAYIAAIGNARHFVYIENQFFITATSDEQHPVENKIGRAIVDRIVRAHQSREDFRFIVLMPAVPAFAGDLKSDGALGTRGIMEFQYNSINRGGHSIMEALQQQGVEDPRQYITFYNLRNYDRINISSTMGRVENDSGVSYEGARREHDDMVGGYPYGGQSDGREGGSGRQYERYQEAANDAKDLTWDSISACYMNAGPDLHNVPWDGDEESELNAFVSEELYIHSKVLIADDRLVICGSANLNDRSQLGTHDSEIAVVIEGGETVESAMNGQPYQASKFATTLRRQLWRKHLGLLPHQPHDRPNANWTPIDRDPQMYDFDSPADRLVHDPMSREFWDLWTGTARSNTEIFNKVFHPVPSDHVRNWEQYDDFFSRHFIVPSNEEDMSEEEKRGRVPYGHVVREEFPGGVRELKDWLNRVRGTLVEMPLEFLIELGQDMAKEGMSLNKFTETVYT
ncbi:phospholipase D domain-containing protein [Apiospora hydei]|uniref:Phospholipase n=1 Tax=Apiospora hydei TaxID=1337664 RepID=A0ABR1W9B2_9PEZI